MSTLARRLLIAGLIGLLCAVAVSPLLRADSPCTHDGGLHYFRVVAIRHALEQGIPFTRWWPDPAFGYGFPFFNYRAAVSYYLALTLHLAGLALPVALNLVYVVSIVGSALTAYLLARDLFGPQAGLIAAIAYAYAPYQFLDALVRANMPEAVALALLPLILWAFRRLVLTGERRWFLVSVISLTALYLTHNISSLLFTPFLVAYVFVLWLIHYRACHWAAAVAALVLALGLAAFFLGPALLERQYVQLHRSRNNRNNDFHYNFVGLAELLALPVPVDTTLMNTPARIQLGLAQTALAGIGLVAGLVRWRDRERRTMLAFFGVAAAAMVWMSTDLSLWVWEHVPLLPFVQFPWRLVGRAILPIALLAGALAAPAQSMASSVPRPRLASFASHALPLALIALLILTALPTTYPPNGYCPKAPHPTINYLFAYEHRSKLVATDPTGSYFPAWVAQRPTGSPLEEQYAAGDTIARLDETTLPIGASIVEAEYGPNQARVVVETPTGFRARYLTFYFPGWSVRVDGEPVELAPTVPEGLITFDVPAGQHTIAIRFGETMLRQATDIISLLSLAILVAGAIRYPRAQSPHPGDSTLESRFRALKVGPLVALAVLLFLAKLAIVDRIETPFRRPSLQPGNALPGVEHLLHQPYADGLTLIGYDQDRMTVPADGILRFDLYWTVSAEPTARYQSVIHLVGPDGMRWSLPDTFRPRGYAKYPSTTTWNPGRYALDSQELEPLPGTPPGDYDVVLTMFDRDSLAPLSILNDNGQPAAPRLTLGQVTLTRPRHRLDPDELPVQHRLNAPLGQLVLVGAEFDRDQLAPGDPVLLTTFWQAGERPSEELSLQLELLAGDGSLAAEYNLPPAASWYPTSAWAAGDVWRGQHFLYLPADLDSGDYAWRIVLLPARQSTALPSTIRVTAPSHTFTAPPVDVQIGTRLGEVATLVGATVVPEEAPAVKPGTTIAVTLVWRAESATTESYRVFLHLLDAEGNLVAQSDAVPAKWARPTTGWLQGEFIVDEHALVIPSSAIPGAYTLSAGLYIPGGARLVAPDGTDALQLTTITVQTQ